MRFMIIVKADQHADAGPPPEKKDVDDSSPMGKFNTELQKAGVLLAAEGLHSSAKGARVTFTGGKHIVKDGPFTESKELVAGFWIWQVKSRAEAIEWVKRAPFGPGAEIEIRQVFEQEEFR